MTTVIERAVARWTNPATRPLFKGSLIDRETGCMCAQGDVLFNEGGFTADALASMAQSEADAKSAKLLGISRAHAVLLRTVNDRSDGQPQNVLTDPASAIGDKADLILAFWRHLDGMDGVQWAAARDAAWAAAWAAARDAAGAAAWAAARDAAWAAARDAAGAAAGAAAWAAAGAAAGAAAWAAEYATSEIQGSAVLMSQGRDFYFLKLFGFNSPADIPLGA